MLIEKHLKTLLIDFDPQANASEIMDNTFKNFNKNPEVSFADGIQKGDLTHSISKANSYLDVLPSNWNLSLLPDLLENYHKSARFLLLRHLLKNIYHHYDYIIIDTPPTLSAYTNNAILASDYVIMVLQTQEQAYSSSLKFVSYLKDLNKDSHGSFNLLGIIPYLIEKRGPVDHAILNQAKKTFGRAMFHAPIYQRERIKRFGRYGIKNDDMWDKRALKMYRALLNEMLSRVKLLEE